MGSTLEGNKGRGSGGGRGRGSKRGRLGIPTWSLLVASSILITGSERPGKNQ